jgi:hypothetical protein
MALVKSSVRARLRQRGRLTDRGGPLAARHPRWLALVAAALVATACGAGAPGRSGERRSSTTALPARTATSAPATTTSSVAPTTTTIDPGRLPQTRVEPPVSSLRNRLMGLWDAIVSGSDRSALPLFFPEAAYLRMKTGLLPDPAADYTDRLIGFYRLDLAAYHRALGSGAATTMLVSVKASPADAAWIPPGACENLIGYWHLPGVRFAYRQKGVVRSFAVASLISWRGTWYVVHLGPNPRPVDVGTVDQPAVGPGSPGPAGGC